MRSDELLNWMPVDALANPKYGSAEILAAPTATDFIEILEKKFAAIGATRRSTAAVRPDDQRGGPDARRDRS